MSNCSYIIDRPGFLRQVCGFLRQVCEETRVFTRKKRSSPGFSEDVPASQTKKIQEFHPRKKMSFMREPKMVKVQRYQSDKKSRRYVSFAE
jgi:hypothetical protein